MIGIKIMNCCKKVLLTGGTGLIGKEAIQPLINEGFEVYAVSSKNLTDNNVKWVKADLLDKNDIKRVFDAVKPEYLLHFAWIASGDYLTSEINYNWLSSSLEMLKEFKKNGGKRAVFAGTCFEYEFQEESLKEDAKLNPTFVYSKCKNELREKAEIYCKENDISFGWGRIFYVYGRGENEKRLTAHVINSLKSGKSVKITSGRLIKDYMYTKDIAGAFVKFLGTNVYGCVNICTGRPISIREYVEKIAAKIGREDLLEFTDDASNQPSMIVGDNSRLLNEVGYKTKFSLDKAINEILEG